MYDFIVRVGFLDPTFVPGAGQEMTLCSVPQRSAEDIRALYCSYLRKEMENRDQQMALRALKMKKLEKELLLLDKQLL